MSKEVQRVLKRYLYLWVYIALVVTALLIVVLVQETGF